MNLSTKSFLVAQNIKVDNNLLNSYCSMNWVKKNCYNLKFCGGRGQTLLFTTPSGNKWVLRHYLRGGFFGKFLKDNFFVFEKHPHRAFEEFKLLQWMCEQGLNVPRPIISRELKTNFFCTIRQDIVLEQIENSSDLAKVISQRFLSNEELKNIGLQINCMFKLGVNHTDLNIRNILLDQDGKVWIIDFDKCFKCILSEYKCRKILDRLFRSFKKECSKEQNKCYFDPNSFKIITKYALLK